MSSIILHKTEHDTPVCLDESDKRSFPMAKLVSNSLEKKMYITINKAAALLPEEMLDVLIAHEHAHFVLGMCPSYEIDEPEIRELRCDQLAADHTSPEVVLKTLKHFQTLDPKLDLELRIAYMEKRTRMKTLKQDRSSYA